MLTCVMLFLDIHLPTYIQVAHLTAAHWPVLLQFIINMALAVFGEAGWPITPAWGPKPWSLFWL